MPEIPNCDLARAETMDTATNKAAKTAAAPSSSGLPVTAGCIALCAGASCGDLPDQYCKAQIAKPESDSAHKGSASMRPNSTLKIATTAKMRRYMIAVASVMPACAWRLRAASALACRARTTVVTVDEYMPPSAAIHRPCAAAAQ